MELKFDPKTVEIPCSKGYIRGKWFQEYVHRNLVKGKFFFYITNLEEQDNVALELLNRLTVEAEYGMNSVVIAATSKDYPLKEKYKKASNVLFVTKGSEEFISNIATAEFVISDAILPAFYMRREGQIYVNLADPEEKGFDRTKEQLEIPLNNTVSNLLNASYLIAPNAAYTLEVYKEKYHLDGIFTGRVIERKETQSAAAFTDELLDLLLSGESNLSLVDISAEPKKKLLFVMDLADNTERDAWKFISMFEELDTNRFDVTVLLPTAPCKEKLEELVFLKNQIRVILKSGRVNYSDEGFIQLSKLRHDFKHGEDVDAIMEERPAKELKEEWVRLLGPASFDIACLVSPQSVYWDAMFMEVDAGQKMNFRNTPPNSDVTNEEEARTYDLNKTKVCNYFDQIVSFYPEVLRQYEESGLITKSKLVFFEDEYCILKMNREFGHVKINGVEYLEFSEARLDANLLTGDYIITPQKGMQSYFLAINENHVEDVEVLLSGLYSFLDDNKGIEIYIGMPYSSKEEVVKTIAVKDGYSDRIHLLYNYLVVTELLEKMDAITEMAYENSRRFSYLAEILGKKYLPIDRTKNYNEKDIVKTTLEALADASVPTETGDFKKKQQSQLTSLFA